MIRKFKDQVRKLVFRFIKPEVRYRDMPNSFSQAGEDVVIDFLFAGIGMEKPKYLELGVYHPISCSNTYKFYLRGTIGVLVEADESQLSYISEQRPNDILINAGVGVGDYSEADFYIFNSKGLNTFDKEEAYRRQNHGTYKITSVVKVALLGINEILEKNFVKYPDLLSIDIEGLDLAVLKSMDFARFPIPVICVETCTYSESHIRPKDYEIAEFLIRQGYEVYADTYINTIFVNKDFSYRIGYAESNDGIKWIRKDGNSGINISNVGWDSEMITYPNVVIHKGVKFMFYNGNGFGASGFGYAIFNSQNV